MLLNFNIFQIVSTLCNPSLLREVVVKDFVRLSLKISPALGYLKRGRARWKSNIWLGGLNCRCMQGSSFANFPTSPHKPYRFTLQIRDSVSTPYMYIFACFFYLFVVDLAQVPLRGQSAVARPSQMGLKPGADMSLRIGRCRIRTWACYAGSLRPCHGTTTSSNLSHNILNNVPHIIGHSSYIEHPFSLWPLLNTHPIIGHSGASFILLLVTLKHPFSHWPHRTQILSLASLENPSSHWPL